MIRDDPSRSELIRPGLAVRVDPVRLLYLPIGDAFYTEVINQSRPPTTGGLGFFRKASAAMLHRNYWKIINFRTPMSNAGRCQFAGGDVDPNSPLKNVKFCRWIVSREFWYLTEPFHAKHLKRHLPRSTGYVNVQRYFLFRADLTISFVLHRLRLWFFLCVCVCGSSSFSCACL